MVRKAKRDLTVEEQLARGPLDLPFLMLILLLLGIGLVMLFSASYYTAYRDSTPAVNHNPYYYIVHQAAYAVAGLVGMYIVSRINYQHFRWMAPLALGVAIVLLIICYIPGLNAPINDVRRWLKVFLVAGPTYQPSEIAKVAVVLFFAARLCKRDTEKQLRFTKRTNTGRMLNYLEKIGFLELVPYGIVLVVVLGLIVFEPHVSGALLVAVGAAAVLLVSGISLWWFISIGGLGAALVGIMYITTDYVKRKFEIWLHPELVDPQDGGFQYWQGIYSISSGGLLGRGLGNSNQKYGFVPEPENDMIFSIICEELGLFGAVAVILMFIMLLWRMMVIANNAPDLFGAMLVVGVMGHIAIQAILNIAVVTATIPNTGISLPFISYGGSSVLFLLIEIGIVLSVAKRIQLKEL